MFISYIYNIYTLVTFILSYKKVEKIYLYLKYIKSFYISYLFFNSKTPTRFQKLWITLNPTYIGVSPLLNGELSAFCLKETLGHFHTANCKHYYSWVLDPLLSKIRFTRTPILQFYHSQYDTKEMTTKQHMQCGYTTEGMVHICAQRGMV